MYELFGYIDISDQEGFLMPIFIKDATLYKGITHHSNYIDFRFYSGVNKKEINEHNIIKILNEKKISKIRVNSEAILCYKTPTEVYYDKVSKLRIDLNKESIKVNTREFSSLRYYDLMCFLGLYNEAFDEGSLIGYNSNQINKYFTFDKTSIGFDVSLNYLAALKPENLEDYFGCTNGILFFGISFLEITGLNVKKIHKKIEKEKASNNFKNEIIDNFISFIEHTLIVSTATAETIPEDLIFQ